MLKKLITLFIVVVALISNNINCAAGNCRPRNRIFPVSEYDLHIAEFDGVCPICKEIGGPLNLLCKVNCPMLNIRPHIYHKHCILEWIEIGHRNSILCPTCDGIMHCRNNN